MWIRYSLGAVLFGALLVAAMPARAATITTSYAAGHADVVINGYGTRSMGTFVLTDGAATSPALCIDAAASHSTAPDGYQRVPNEVDSPELDYLLWRHLPTDGSVDIDDDTAVALAALAWFYADAMRDIGVPVWADGSRGFAPVTPVEPVPWDALPSMTVTSPIGLRAGATDLDDAERAVLALHEEAHARRGPWELSPVRVANGTATVAVTAPGGAITGAGVRFVAADLAGRVLVEQVAATNDRGWVSITLPELAQGGQVTAMVTSPGVHEEWDGAGAVQRMATAASAELVEQTAIEPPAATTTTTTVPPTVEETTTTTTMTTTTTTEASTTTTSTPATSTTSSTSTTSLPPAVTTTTSSTTPPAGTTTSTTATVPLASTPPTAAPPDTVVSRPPSLPTTGGGRAQLFVGLASMLVGGGGLVWSLLGLTVARTRRWGAARRPISEI